MLGNWWFLLEFSWKPDNFHSQYFDSVLIRYFFFWQTQQHHQGRHFSVRVFLFPKRIYEIHTKYFIMCILMFIYICMSKNQQICVLIYHFHFPNRNWKNVFLLTRKFYHYENVCLLASLCLCMCRCSRNVFVCECACVFVYSNECVCVCMCIVLSVANSHLLFRHLEMPRV